MKDQLVIYAYNVLFGDAILVEVPDGAARRFLLIDVGNVLSGPGSADQPLLGVVKDIKERTGGGIDLYISTHEHMDHVQGLLYAKQNGCELYLKTAWMTASANPDYYANHPDARKKRLELQQAAEAFRQTLGPSALPPALSALLEINARSTDDCVDYLRQAADKVHYLYLGAALEGLHPFTQTKLRVLAPEENTAVYFDSVAHLTPAAGAPVGARVRPLPLPGIDAGSFYELVDRMDNGLSESLFAIDRAANNTSLVVELTWRGKRFLFPGDAELKSWQKMVQAGVLQPVDMLKVGHHGSGNGTPPPSILDRILPPARRKQALAVVSTCEGVYNGVPDAQTLDALRARTSRVYSTLDVPVGQPAVISFRGEG